MVQCGLCSTTLLVHTRLRHNLVMVVSASRYVLLTPPARSYTKGGARGAEMHCVKVQSSRAYVYVLAISEIEELKVSVGWQNKLTLSCNFWHQKFVVLCRSRLAF